MSDPHDDIRWPEWAKAEIERLTRELLMKIAEVERLERQCVIIRANARNAAIKEAAKVAGDMELIEDDAGIDLQDRIVAAISALEKP